MVKRRGYTWVIASSRRVLNNNHVTECCACVATVNRGPKATTALGPLKITSFAENTWWSAGGLWLKVMMASAEAEAGKWPHLPCPETECII